MEVDGGQCCVDNHAKQKGRQVGEKEGERENKGRIKLERRIDQGCPKGCNDRCDLQQRREEKMKIKSGGGRSEGFSFFLFRMSFSTWKNKQTATRLTDTCQDEM
jgi:hypothetical protein